MSSRHRGGVLAGHQFDLQDWTEELVPPHEPWVEKWEIEGTPRVVLRSMDFERINDHMAVFEMAKLLTKRLNGAFATQRHAQPLTVEGLAERRPDGSIGQHIFWAVGAAHGRGRGGSLSAPQIGPTQVQQWLQMAQEDELVEDLLIHQSEPANWYDLYKSYEAINTLCGNRDLKKRPWWPSKEKLSSFRRTANSFRHSLAHASRKEPAQSPMPIGEAKEMIRTMADELLKEMSKLRVF